MRASIVFNGVTYQIPLPGDTSGWGTILDTLFSGLAAGASGKNVVNTFVAKQTLSAGLALGPQAVPTQTAEGQLYTGSDGNLYGLPGTPNAAVPVQLTAPGSGTVAFTIKTANYTLLAADSGQHFVTTGAGGSVAFTLPAPAINLTYTLTATALQTVTIVGANSTAIVGPGGLSGQTITIAGTFSASRYTSVKVSCFDGTHWLVEYVFGTASIA